MSKIILRKPKFMRNENAMESYMFIIDAQYGLLTDSKYLTDDQKYDLMMRLNENIKKASKAGGFFRVKDFVDYYNKR